MELLVVVVLSSPARLASTVVGTNAIGVADASLWVVGAGERHAA